MGDSSHARVAQPSGETRSSGRPAFDSVVKGAESRDPYNRAVLPRSSSALPRGGSLAFFPSRNRSVPRLPSRKTPVIAVGQHVFVNCPASPSGSVLLASESGEVRTATQLPDGVEVEVVAWRPRVAGDAFYRVRAPSNGADGWLPAGNLRRTLVPLPTPEPPTAQPMPVADGRRFGQWSQTERPPVVGAPSPAEPSPGADSRGRRFGQRF